MVGLHVFIIQNAIEQPLVRVLDELFSPREATSNASALECAGGQPSLSILASRWQRM